MNIQNAQQQVDDWIKNHGVRYFNELTNMAQLTEEVGEVARIIARRYGEQSEKESDKGKDLGEELADVLFVVLCLANQTGINLQESFENKLDTFSKTWNCVFVKLSSVLLLLAAKCEQILCIFSFGYFCKLDKSSSTVWALILFSFAHFLEASS